MYLLFFEFPLTFNARSIIVCSWVTASFNYLAPLLSQTNYDANGSRSTSPLNAPTFACMGAHNLVGLEPQMVSRSGSGRGNEFEGKGSVIILHWLSAAGFGHWLSDWAHYWIIKKRTEREMTSLRVRNFRADGGDMTCFWTFNWQKGITSSASHGRILLDRVVGYTPPVSLTSRDICARGPWRKWHGHVADCIPSRECQYWLG